jgi:hypothetical protein
MHPKIALQRVLCNLIFPKLSLYWLVVTAILAVTTVRAVLALLGSRHEPAEQPAVA